MKLYIGINKGGFYPLYPTQVTQPAARSRVVLQI
nr:MAG TPA: hypothetical protein [Caudoviricetes sp.]